MKTNKQRRWKCSPFIAVLLLVVAGCDRVSNVNGEQVFEYELWAPLTTLLVGLVAIPIGWRLRNGIPRLGCCMIFAGPIAAGVVAPSMFLTRVVVGADHFEVRNGLWWSSNVRTFEFAGIDEIGLTKVITLGRRGKRTNDYLVCCDKSGQSCRVSIDNPVTRAAAGAILREAGAHGIRIRGSRGEGIRAHGNTGGQDW